jgi:hypothetical protein
MADTEILTAVKATLFDALSPLHESINKVGKEQALTNQKITEHISREEIHKPIPEACDKSKENRAKLEKHEENHSAIVRTDIGKIIGAAIVTAALVWVAALAFGG